MVTMDVKDQVVSATRAYQECDYINAARLFGEAASAFLAQGDQLDAAEMKNNQSVALLQAGEARASLNVLEGTAQVFSTNHDFRRQGMALGNEASALKALGRIDTAEQQYRLAVVALEKAGEDQLRASVLQALAGIQLRKGKLMDALLSMQMGLSGVKHPSLKQKLLLNLLRFRV